MTLDLASPDSNLRAFMKARASLDGADTVVWFTGDVHAVAPGQPGRHVFGFEGYNVARALQVDGGFELLTREAVFYLDPATRAILDSWDNPFTDETVDVIHVWNDPVNHRFEVDGPRGPWRLPVTDLGDDVVFTSDVFLAYPSPLPPEQFPRHSQSALYQAAELFQFFCRRDDLADDSPSAPARVSWTRIAPWVPFMAMGDRPGYLVYHCQGTKLAGGFAALPAQIRERVLAEGPAFAGAPETFTQPNETSWTYFRKLASPAAV